MGREHWPEVLRIYLEGIAKEMQLSWSKRRHGKSGTAVICQISGWLRRRNRRSSVGLRSARSHRDACMRVWPKFPYMSRKRLAGKESANRCYWRWSNPPRIAEYGLCRLVSFLRTLPALHCIGFREVDRRERIGKMGDAWRDVVLLERRSPKVGI